MNGWRIAGVAFAGLSLFGCSKGESFGDLGGGHGRYSGVGIYGPSTQWTRLIANQTTKDTQAARPIDDQVIIVVQDSVTGEVRACGDLTGYCIGMNPWRTALVSAQITPIKLTKHRAPDTRDTTVELTARPSSGAAKEAQDESQSTSK